MITLHNAIFAANPSVVTVHGDVAYDAQGNEVTYDKSAAEAKLVELQSAEQAQATAKASALAKLTALGLTEDEVKSLLG